MQAHEELTLSDHVNANNWKNLNYISNQRSALHLLQGIHS